MLECAEDWTAFWRLFVFVLAAVACGGRGAKTASNGDAIVGQILMGGADGVASCAATGIEAHHLVDPVDVAIGVDGTFYVLDKGCVRVTQGSLSGFSVGGQIVAGGSEGAFSNNLLQPEAVHFNEDDGHIYIADTVNQRIMRWLPGGADGTLVARGTGHTSNGDLGNPVGLFVRDGTLYVVEELNHRLQQFVLATCCADPTKADGMTIFGCPEFLPPNPPPAICSTGYDMMRLRGPSHVFVTPDLSFFVADTFNHRVIQLYINHTRANPDHEFSNFSVVAEVVAGTTGIPGCRSEQLRFPTGVAVDEDGFLYVSDTGNHRVQKFAPGRQGGRVGVTVAGECCCARHDSAGVPLGGSASHQLSGPAGIAIDKVNGSLLIVDRGNRRVVVVGSSSQSPRAPSAACAYGVECSLRLASMLRPRKQNQLLIARRDVWVNGTLDNTTSPCGSLHCSVAAWRGVENPKIAGGAFLDSYFFGLPEGPIDDTSSGIGEYTLCFSVNPSMPCEDGGRCLAEDNCTNSSSWLCGGVEPFGIRRQRWDGIVGTTISDLRAWPGFPHAPDIMDALPSFETPANDGDDYGQKLSGVLVAPLTGTYVFYVTSNTNSELRLSKVHNVTLGERIAWISDSDTVIIGEFSHSGYSQGPDDWVSFPSQKGTVDLEAGELYWLEVLHKASNGMDFLRVGVTLPDGTTLKPIPGSSFEAHACVIDAPFGLGVIHDCAGKTTGQSCTASCSSGFVGEQQTFRCNGLRRFVGVDPTCTSATCLEYDVEVGSFFMHGVLESLAARTPPQPPRPCVLRAPWCSIVFSEGAGNLQGSGAGGYHFGAHTDAGGNTLVADSRKHEVVRFRWQGHVFETVAGGRGAGNRADQLSSPNGVYFVHGSAGTPGTFYVADTGNHRIVRWLEGAATGEVILGAGARASASLRYPMGVHVDLPSTNSSGSHGTLYVFDYGNMRVLQADLADDGSVGNVTVYGQGLSAMYLGEALLELPFLPAWGIGADTFLDTAGNFFSVDYGNHRLAACFSGLRCRFNLCRDVDPSAEWGAECGCLAQAASCGLAYGSLHGRLGSASELRPPNMDAL